MAISNLKFYSEPSLTVKAETYDMKVRPSCGFSLDTGSFYATAAGPKHGADANTVVSEVSYFITRTGGAPFSSSMNGADIRLKNIIIPSLPYLDINGIPQSFSGSINIDFVSKIKKVVNSNTLQLTQPFTISYYSLNSAITSEDSTYLENNQVDTEKFGHFNETDAYFQSGKASGTNLSNAVYAVSPTLRNNFYVSSIQSGRYEIIHSPRLNGSDFSAAVNRKCVVNLTLSNLNAYSGSLGAYKVFQKSMALPTQPVLVSEGPFVANELLVSVSSSYEDTRRMGHFYNGTQASTYFFPTGSVSFSWSPDILIDSISITSSAALDNTAETSYIIMKDNTPETGSITPDYIKIPYYSGSYWYTSPLLFANSSVEPTASYQCVSGSSTLTSYSSSIEVMKTGSIYNSNSVKLIKNTMYEFSLNYANINYISQSLFELIVYYASTSPTGVVTYTRIGDINNLTTRGFLNGTYVNRFLANKTTFGTIKIVPKYLNKITISNLSLKPFFDSQYSINSVSLRIPVQPNVQNEKAEFTVDLYDTNGDLVLGNGPASNFPSFLRRTVYLDQFGLAQVAVSSGTTVSASYAITASYALSNAGTASSAITALTASYVATASWALNAVTSSYVLSSSYSSTSTSASYSLSSSYSLTASYAANVPISANPSTNIGLGVTNGSATTFMRSDGAPALSQAITPNWTGPHTFSAITSLTTFVAGSTTSPQSSLNPGSGAITASFQLIGTAYAGSALGLFEYQNATPQAASILFHKSRGAIGSFTTLTSGDSLGLIAFNGSDGTQWINGTALYAEVSGSVSAGVLPSRWRFSTAGVDRAYIDAVGFAVVGSVNVTNSVSSSFLFVSGSSFHGNFVTIDLNYKSGSLPTPVNTGVVLQLGNIDNVSAGIEGVSYGTTGLALQGRAFGGTRASPTATAASQALVVFQAFGYDTASYISGAGSYRISANSLHSVGSHEVIHIWQGAPSGSTTQVNWMTLDGANGLKVLLPVSASSFSGPLTGSLLGTASYAVQALSASYVLSSSYAFSSSYAVSASWAPGSGASPGNPTAFLGLTAINGVAATYMRSDAAPALSQSISPTWTGTHSFNPAARSGGSQPYFIISGAADTGLATTVESIGISHVGATRTWVDGTTVTQREYVFGAPTYNKTTTSAIFTNAATVAITGAPAAGAGVTLTNPFALWLQAGKLGFGAAGSIASIGQTSGLITITSIGGMNTAAGGNYGVTNGGSGTASFSGTGMDFVISDNSSFSNWQGAAITGRGLYIQRAGANVDVELLTIGTGNDANFFGNIGNGSYGSVTATETGRNTRFSMRTFGGSTWVAPSAMFLTTTEAQTETARGSKITFSTTKNTTVGANAVLTLDQDGSAQFTAPVRTAGSPFYFQIQAPADTGLAANTEAVGVRFAGATRTWLDGAVALQREIAFNAPTYNKTTTSTTFGIASTFYVQGAPIAGSGVTISKPLAALFNGNVEVIGVFDTAAAARTSGTASYFQIVTPADTGITSGVESIGAYFQGATRTWADGVVATQREFLITAPTYNKTTTTGSFTKAATFAITGAPVAGAGIAITSSYALWVQSGATQLDGNTSVTGQFTASIAIMAGASTSASYLGPWGFAAGYTGFGHASIFGTNQGNYALLQGSAGDTYLNAASGQSTHFRIANSDVAVLTSNLLTMAGSISQTSPFVNTIWKDTGGTATVTNGGLIRFAGAGDGSWYMQWNSTSSADFASVGNITRWTTGGQTLFGTMTINNGLFVTGSVVVTGSISDYQGNVRSIMPNIQSSGYTLVGSDAGKHINISTGGVTVPTGSFAIGDVVSIFNNSNSNQTITQGASVTLYQAGTASTGNRTLAQRGLCSVLCVSGSVSPTAAFFVITGVGLT